MIYSPTAFVGDFLLLRQQTARGTCGTVPVGTRSQTPLALSAAAKAFAEQTPSPWLRHGAAGLRTAGLPRRRTTVRLPAILKKPRNWSRSPQHQSHHHTAHYRRSQISCQRTRQSVPRIFDPRCLKIYNQRVKSGLR